MKVRDLIKLLLDCPPDSDVYISKGIGPVATVETEVSDRIFVILSPE
jgi:hypothetical protein